MSEQDTAVEEVVETTPETEVQPEQTAFEDIADGLLDEVTPEVEPEETTEEPEETIPDIAAEDETPTYKVKVDGEESEVDIDELIKGYQYQAHNTRKAQDLADRERELAAYEGLAKKLKTDAGFAEHVFGYGKEQPEELDPIEQIKAEAVAAAEEKVEKKFASQAEQAKQRQIDNLKTKVQQDPLYKQVQDKLANYIMSMPKSLQQQMYQTLDSDPQAYTEMYQKARATIEQPETTPQKVKPPVLVDSGTTQEVPTETTNINNRKKMKAEMLKTGDLSKLQEYFTQPGGLADQLI